MKQATQIINGTQLKQFAPLEKLSDEDAQELLRTAISVNLSPGMPLFSDEINSEQLFYLVKGKIELSSSGNKTIIEAGSKVAHKPISRQADKQAVAVAIDESTLISFDTDMLDLFLNWTNPNAYVVNEVETSKDHEWLNQLLKSRGLLRFSEQQINTLLERMNEVHFNKGDVVISQDDDDGFYYVIKEGSATVSRKPSETSKEIKLADLGEGDGFGEESILTHKNRSATITMKESGNLLRLSKQDFSKLLAQPLLETVSWDKAQAMNASGAEFIDIRLEEEFNELHVPGSINIPLPLLRLKIKTLDQHKKYIICCDDGSRSSVAAFLLNRQGFDAFILDGGMTSYISQLADLEMDKYLTEAKSEIGATTPEEIIDTNEQGNQFCSLAEHWGDTVKQVDNEGFSDNEALFKVEKTTVTNGVKQSFATTNYNLPKQKSAPVETNVFQDKDTATTGNMFRNILAGLVMAILAAAVAMYYFSANDARTKKLITPTTPTSVDSSTEQPIETSSTPKEITAPLSPMTRFVEPPAQNIENSSANQATTELVGDAGSFMTDSEIKELEQSIIEATPATSAAPTALDPATRGFIE